jgi:hypothetical protein
LSMEQHSMRSSSSSKHWLQLYHTIPYIEYCTYRHDRISPYRLFVLLVSRRTESVAAPNTPSPPTAQPHTFHSVDRTILRHPVDTVPVTDHRRFRDRVRGCGCGHPPQLPRVRCGRISTRDQRERQSLRHHRPCETRFEGEREQPLCFCFYYRIESSRRRRVYRRDSA